LKYDRRIREQFSKSPKEHPDGKKNENRRDTGPACGDLATIRELIREGVDVFRLNFSHKTYDEANNEVTMIREARKALDKPVAIMADIKGPAVRLYGYTEPLAIQPGAELTIESTEAVGIEKLAAKKPMQVYTNLPDIDRICAVGQKVILMDGYFTGKVVRKVPKGIVVALENEGNLRPKAHLTLPGVDYPIPFLSEKDIADISWAVEQDIDYIALSFVRCETDVEEVKRLVQRTALAQGKNTLIKLIAKIESARGSKISTRLYEQPTASWWHGATWAWRCPSRMSP